MATDLSPYFRLQHQADTIGAIADHIQARAPLSFEAARRWTRWQLDVDDGEAYEKVRLAVEMLDDVHIVDGIIDYS